jgi:hypothetical protein
MDVSADRVAESLTDRRGRLATLMTTAVDRGVHVEAVRDFGLVLDAEMRKRRADAALCAFGDLPKELFGDAFSGSETPVAPLKELLAAARGLLDAGLPAGALRWFGEDPARRRLQLQREQSVLHGAWQKLHMAATAFGPYGTIDVNLLGGEAGTTTAAVERLLERRQALDELPEWGIWSRLREEARELGLEPMLGPIEDGSVNSNLAAAVFDWCRCGTLIDRALALRPVLERISGSRRTILAKQFAQMDEAMIAWNRHVISKSASQRKAPNGISRGLVRNRTELGLLRHECNKSRSHLPVRQLLTRAGEALQALKPCFMMSPLAVSRFLPHQLTFDVLVVDEASQLRPEDCLGAIARCKQLVVVGDPKQLPPTSFFDRLMGGDAVDEDDETTFDQVESILDVVSSNLAGGRRLLWHYRSRHQDLIRFSNGQFYDGTLTVFPTPRPSVPGRGVEMCYLAEARYAAGRNRVEAEAVAAEAAALLLANYPGSIGIAAFNSAQRDCIDDCLEALAQANPKLMARLQARLESPEPVFVKNLENVQGDERDVMLLSFTYGPSAEDGRVYQRFGPINTQTGWRRLNVLLTRARERIVVFSSMQASDVVIKKDSSRGVKALKAFLEYAVAPEAAADVEAAAEQRTSSDFGTAVADVLSSRGLATDARVGDDGCTLELAVRDASLPGAYRLGIDSDGLEFFGNPVAKERERIRPQVLAGLGWNIHQIHSVDWFRDREGEIKSLLAAVKGEG